MEIGKILGIIFVIAFLVWVFLPTEDYDSDSDIPEINIEPIIEDQFSNVEQFHYPHMPIRYKLSNPEGCSVPLKNVELSFDILENRTESIVSFEEVNGEEDIDIQCINRDDFDRMFEDFDNCKKELKECANYSYDYERFSFSAYDEGILDRTKEVAVSVRNIFASSTKTIYEVCSVSLETSDYCYDLKVENQEVFEKLYSNELLLGEATPFVQGNILINGTLFLYDNDDRWKSCSRFPVREMHELLHLFAFGHVQELERYRGVGELILETPEQIERYQDIMYPKYSCAGFSKLNEEYVSCLKYIYSNGSQGECLPEVNFLEFGADGFVEESCELGWYPVEDTEHCCPEPDMYIDEEGFCTL
tara:strand:- start:98 stop:1180 length:1083 start_codon:yes stop_codon:yes gene_type:complete